MWGTHILLLVCRHRHHTLPGATASALATLELLERTLTLQAPPQEDVAAVVAALCAFAAASTSLAEQSGAMSTAAVLLTDAACAAALPPAVLRLVYATAVACGAAHGVGAAADTAATVALAARAALPRGHPFTVTSTRGSVRGGGAGAGAGAGAGDGIATAAGADSTALARRVHAATAALYAPLMSTRWVEWVTRCETTGGAADASPLAAWLTSLVVRAQLSEEEVEVVPGGDCVPAWAHTAGVGGVQDDILDTVSAATGGVGERRGALEMAVVTSCLFHAATALRHVACTAWAACALRAPLRAIAHLPAVVAALNRDPDARQRLGLTRAVAVLSVETSCVQSVLTVLEGVMSAGGVLVAAALRALVAAWTLNPRIWPR